MRHRYRLALAAGLALLALLGVGPARLGAEAAATPPEVPAEERWYATRIAGHLVGYVHETVATAADGAVTSTLESSLELSRLGARVSIGELDVEHEDRDGHLRNLRSETRASRETTVLEAVVRDGVVELDTEAGGRRYHEARPETRALLGPEGVRRRTALALAQGEPGFRYATFVAELGAVSDVERRVLGPDPGAPAAQPRFLVEERLAALPGPGRLVVDSDGRVLRETQAGPFGEIELAAADASVREAVGREPESGVLYAGSLVHANIRLPDPRGLDGLRLRLTLRDPSAGFPVLEGPGQRIVEAAPDHVVVEITRVAAPAPRADLARGVARREVAPNMILQSDDPAVQEVARSLRDPRLGPYAQARRLQDWVSTQLRFEPGLAIVPASEAVRDRRGSCVAYAVLLASLARALDIPARVVLGYVYVAGVFGGHAWVEVRAGDRWIPLDAAVPRAGPADAARLAIVRHQGEQGGASGAAELARVFGNESIRVEAYRRAGTWTRVAPEAPPYRLEADRYENPWLGVTVVRPPGFTFGSADAVYPDPTVITLESASGDVLALRQVSVPPVGWRAGATLAGLGAAEAVTVGSAPALLARRTDRARLERRHGSELWLIEATGTQAVAALPAVLAQWRLP
ncbi:MAG: transglutaminase domain-containing protein [Proteobacteria bacterium]|nr:transglutaminase domain-containing protein [Pseudomonadota bacterium]